MRMYGAFVCVAIAILATGCISQEEYDAVVRERNQTEVDLRAATEKSNSVQSDLELATAKLEEAGKKMQTIQKENVEFAGAREKLEARVTTLTEDLEVANQNAKVAELNALECEAKLKTALADISELRAKDSKIDARMANVKVQAEKIQLQFGELSRLLAQLESVLSSEPTSTKVSGTEETTNTSGGDE
jgi:chromosome segregation ATPase